ncbi:MAG: colanic acid biosynthesis glycosyltransferase WcaL [Opitutaceae bacterium]|nr:colanic acid biosynthesis glycosyltransferase WcaL [Opitutaceae bacterium]
MMKPLRILYICTTFPKLSEQFIQREVDGLRSDDFELEVVSLWGGEKSYKGDHIHTFPKWELIALLWMVPWAVLQKPKILFAAIGKLLSGRPPSVVNFFETLLGMGFAFIRWVSLGRDPPDLIHGIWATSPVSAAFFLSDLIEVPFSMGAHAFDVFEDGGDWHLKDKLSKALLVHTSSQSTQRQLMDWGVETSKVKVVRRGLTDYPDFKPLRSNRRPIRILSVGRLVEKKGFFYQIDIFKALKRQGVAFNARIIGSGSLDVSLRDYRDTSGLRNELEFWGKLAHKDVQKQFVWADVFLFTGRVSSRGDRDGLPNVIGEAMAHGVVVLTTDVGATTEAVEHEISGLVLPGNDEHVWFDSIQKLVEDNVTMERFRTNGRQWVEEHFNAHKNSGKLRKAFQLAVHMQSHSG